MDEDEGKEGTYGLASLEGVGFEDDGLKGPAPFGPYNYLPTKAIHTPYQYTYHHTLATYHVTTSYHNTHS